MPRKIKTAALEMGARLAPASGPFRSLCPWRSCVEGVEKQNACQVVNNSKFE